MSSDFNNYDVTLNNVRSQSLYPEGYQIVVFWSLIFFLFNLSAVIRGQPQRENNEFGNVLVLKCADKSRKICFVTYYDTDIGNLRSQYPTFRNSALKTAKV